MQAEAVTFTRCTPTVEVSASPAARNSRRGVALIFASGQPDAQTKHNTKAGLYQKASYHMTPAEALELGNQLINAAAIYS